MQKQRYLGKLSLLFDCDVQCEVSQRGRHWNRHFVWRIVNQQYTFSISEQESPAVADKPARRLRKVCTVYVRAVGL